jgi:hypothetical protein
LARQTSRKTRADTPHSPARPEPDEQSGSTGRDPGPPSNDTGVDGKPGTGANTGQGNYGQSGLGQGGYSKGGSDTPNYQKDVAGRKVPRSRDSNRGSGLPDSEVDGASANEKRDQDE